MVTKMTRILLVLKEYCKHMHGMGLYEYMSLRGHNEQSERATVRQPNTQANANTDDTMEVTLLLTPRNMGGWEGVIKTQCNIYFNSLSG
jgi:hypothetical protein